MTAPADRRAERLHRHVSALAAEIGERHLGRPAALAEAADYIERALAAPGHRVHRQWYAVGGEPCANVEVAWPGRRRGHEVVIIGAHYDTMPGTPGANDNASAVAVLIELARSLAEARFERTLRLVALTNEESPHAWTDRMGSKVYADRCRARRERIVGMVALDGLGRFSDAPHSQRYPLGLGAIYPSRADFLAFIANFASAWLLARARRAFRRATDLPTRAAVLPGWLPVAARSDHWSFWRHRYRAMLVTDTLPFRDANYHRATDMPDQLDYHRMSRAAQGLAGVAHGLAQRID